MWYVFAALTGFFIASLTVANMTAAKLIHWGSIGGVELLTPAAVLAYALTFMWTDIISEVFGKKAARKVVWIGFFSQLLMLGLVEFAILMPEPVWQGELASWFKQILGSTWFIVAASLIAYLVSQHHDVWAFHKWREVTRGRHLWLRNNLSTMVSQGIDTVLFISLAFGILPCIILGKPLIPWSALPSLMLGQYLAKIIIAVLDTPLVYVGVRIVRQK